MQAPQASTRSTPLCAPGGPTLGPQPHTYSSHHTSHTRIPHRGCTDRTHIQVPQTAPLLDTMYDLATHRTLSANTEKPPLEKTYSTKLATHSTRSVSNSLFTNPTRSSLQVISTVDTKESSSEKYPTLICSTSETRRDEDEHFWEKQLQKS